MPHAIRFHKAGGPEVLQWEDVAVGKPGPGEARVRHTAVGLNYVDTYVRSGLYPAPLPSGLGNEAAGVVEEVGPGVGDVKAGDRVAYAGGGPGSYSEVRVMPADRLVVLPKGISDEQAAAMMLKGMTTQYLIRQIYKVKQGDTILFHAAAGGVGLIACQWAKALGATVIGTVGSDEKAKLAKAHGCDHPIVYTREDFAARVREITGGEGVPVVYDSVGRATFEGSLKCLRRRGVMASFGEASGDPEPVSPRRLGQLGSIYLTHPSISNFTATRAELVETANDLFAMVRSGTVRITISKTYPLRDAPQAHADIEQRKTTGSIVLVP
jgi:NADPH:quinone reductase